MWKSKTCDGMCLILFFKSAACEEVKEVTEEKVEKMKDVTLSKCASVKKEVTEEDLEDWLDSMISWWSTT